MPSFLREAECWADGIELGRVIGRGGMGEVFLAEDTVLGREVAVKHILASEEDSVVATQRLLREARSAARIHHPHVVTVHDLVIEGHRGPTSSWSTCLPRTSPR